LVLGIYQKPNPNTQKSPYPYPNIQKFPEKCPKKCWVFDIFIFLKYLSIFSHLGMVLSLGIYQKPKTKPNK